MASRNHTLLLAPLRALAVAGAVALAAPAPTASAVDPFLRRTAAVEVAQKVGPAVVNILTEVEVQQQTPFGRFRGDPFFERFFRDFFDPGMPRQAQSLGSGVLIDADGHVLTNEHVIGRASRIKVSLQDGREFDATLIGADPNNDLAVLQVASDEKLPWVAPGRSDDLLVGEPVIAIGNPFGLSHTVTTGVISALDRSIRASGDRAFYGFIQTDASINPGNSGGPLLNAEGTLIGINTAIYQGAEGIGFAVPIDVARRIVDELLRHGEVAPVWLGLELQDLDPRLHSALDLPRGTQGALVSGVAKGAPAARAGVRRGDLVMRADGHKVQTARDFFGIIERVTPGQDIDLELWRDGRKTRLAARAERISDPAVRTLAERLLGMALVPAERGGVRVGSVRARSQAEQIGFQAGDLLLAINGRPLADPEAFRRAVLGLQGRQRALVVVQRGTGRYHVTVPLT
ncbi:trypsin-like peptidase domain-containing protein [Myxococcota bacterium]|nr:trypsin-like peptidase domain-containing protein [Myxococcota bacterium]MCZ7618429.1 trypsin-like peptidase domain-containing protein [Myxococcota bacterium]